MLERRRFTTSAGYWPATAFALAWLLLGCGEGGAALERPPPACKSPEASTQLQVVRAQTDAFNRKDVAGLVANVAPDFKWLSVSQDQITTEVEGREALRASMESYFASLPSAHSTVEAVFVDGSFVAVRERASWVTAKGEPRSQSSIAVYDVRDGKIFRVWYYPSHR